MITSMMLIHAAWTSRTSPSRPLDPATMLRRRADREMEA